MIIQSFSSAWAVMERIPEAFSFTLSTLLFCTAVPKGLTSESFNSVSLHVPLPNRSLTAFIFMSSSQYWVSACIRRADRRTARVSP